MRRIMFVFLVFGLLACSPAERPADKSVASSGSEMSQESAVEPTGYVEYLWCTDGENYSVESVKAREEIWLEEVSQLGLSRMGSAEITRWVGLRRILTEFQFYFGRTRQNVIRVGKLI